MMEYEPNRWLINALLPDLCSFQFTSVVVLDAYSQRHLFRSSEQPKIQKSFTGRVPILRLA